jgi:hypothetical protein
MNFILKKWICLLKGRKFKILFINLILLIYTIQLKNKVLQKQVQPIIYYF